MSARIRVFRAWPRLLALGAVSFLLVACASSASAPLAQNGAAVGAPDAGGAGPVFDARSGAVPAPAAPSGGNATDSTVAPSDLLIIKTGNLDLQVAGIDEALSAANTKITALGGYIASSQRSGEADKAAASITYRIPAANWDQALVALRSVGTKILDEQTQSQEVTGQVLDLGARITNLQATEAALQAIMVKAIKISDVLDVQTQLTTVRGQIEQLTTEQKHLSEQAALGTLTVGLSLASAPAVATVQKGFDPGAQVDQAVASLVELGQNLATVGIWLGIVGLPLLLVFGLLALIVSLVLRRIRRRRPQPAPLASPPPAWTPPSA